MLLAWGGAEAHPGRESQEEAIRRGDTQGSCGRGLKGEGHRKGQPEEVWLLSTNNMRDQVSKEASQGEPGIFLHVLIRESLTRSIYLR